MLTEFLKLIQETAVKAAGAQVLRTAVDSREAFVVNNGELTPILIPPPLRNHALGSVGALCEFAETFAAKGSVWHDEEQIVVVLDNDDRRDVATLDLEKSAPFVRLEFLADKRPALTQRDLIRLLRHELRSAGAEHVLSSVKRLDFKRSNDGRSNLEHGKESLGRSVEMAVNSAEAIPEFFLSTVSVYTTPGAEYQKTIYATLEIDVQNERFVVLPDDDSITDAIHDVQHDLHGALVEALGDIPVYYGRPWREEGQRHGNH